MEVLIVRPPYRSWTNECKSRPSFLFLNRSVLSSQFPVLYSAALGKQSQISEGVMVQETAPSHKTVPKTESEVPRLSVAVYIV